MAVRMHKVLTDGAVYPLEFKVFLIVLSSGGPTSVWKIATKRKKKTLETEEEFCPFFFLFFR